MQRFAVGHDILDPPATKGWGQSGNQAQLEPVADWLEPGITGIWEDRSVTSSVEGRGATFRAGVVRVPCLILVLEPPCGGFNGPTTVLALVGGPRRLRPGLMLYVGVFFSFHSINHGIQSVAAMTVWFRDALTEFNTHDRIPSRPRGNL